MRPLRVLLSFSLSLDLFFFPGAPCSSQRWVSSSRTSPLTLWTFPPSSDFRGTFFLVSEHAAFLFVNHDRSRRYYWDTSGPMTLALMWILFGRTNYDFCPLGSVSRTCVESKGCLLVYYLFIDCAVNRCYFFLFAICIRAIK